MGDKTSPVYYGAGFFVFRFSFLVLGFEWRIWLVLCLEAFRL